ncbi:NACHT domain-containing protein, partial [Nostocoides australiense]|uniref:NACHT domain-containing protein n=1 Tax=Nostocoides australiense TaxID=99480 RepID=UPI00138F07EC
MTQELSQRQRDRLEALVQLMDDQRLIRLDQALDASTTPGTDDKRLSLFRQLRAALDAAAADAGIELHLAADKSKDPPAQRVCWFEGADTTAVELSEMSRASASEGVPADPVAPMLMRALPARVHVSFALTEEPARRRLIDDLINRLRAHLRTRGGEADCVVTSSGEVHLGDAREKERSAAIAAADVVVALVSTAYAVETDGDLDHLGDVPVVPVALTAIEAGRDLAPLEVGQIVGQSRPYAACRTSEDKDAFVREVLVTIRHRLAPSSLRDMRTNDPVDAVTAYSRGTVGYLRPAHRLVPPVMATGELEAWATNRGRTSRVAETALPAVETLAAWAGDPQSTLLTAVLGDLGMGKTTTMKLLTEHLLDRRLTHGAQAAPLPLLFDLRRISVEQYRSARNLRGIVEALLDAETATGHRPTVDAVLNAVNTGNCLVIFDGLDEILVHLTDREGQEFTRALLDSTRVFWQNRKDPSGATSATQPSKLLVTCRTHYFRSVKDETAHFTGQDRGGPGKQSWQLLFVLPFGEDQIRDYLAANIPGADVDALMGLLASVHDLRGMAERPLTLMMISDELEFVERAKLAGSSVRPVDIYAAMTDRWLARDNGKHTLLPEHKQELMEHLAAELWREGRRSWSARQLDQWLVDFLAARPAMRRHYPDTMSPQLWQEDLRTASFVSRRADDEFRFAHSSLLEYFLARYLAAALRLGPDRMDVVRQRWAMPVPSQETLDFFGQLIAGTPEVERRALGALDGLAACYTPQTSEVLLAYALSASQHNHPLPKLHGAHLEGARLRDWSLGVEGNRLSLSGAHLDNADLSRTVIRGIDLTGAQLAGANLEGSLVRGCSLRGAQLDRANLAGAVFRHTDMVDASSVSATTHLTAALFCAGAGAMAGDWQLGPAPAAPPRPSQLHALTGHTGSVWAVA